jgi:hypothetical protein
MLEVDFVKLKGRTLAFGFALLAFVGAAFL